MFERAILFILLKQKTIIFFGVLAKIGRRRGLNGAASVLRSLTDSERDGHGALARSANPVLALSYGRSQCSSGKFFYFVEKKNDNFFGVLAK